MMKLPLDDQQRFLKAMCTGFDKLAIWVINESVTDGDETTNAYLPQAAVEYDDFDDLGLETVEDHLSIDNMSQMSRAEFRQRIQASAQTFIHYLDQYQTVIDIWNGDSLLWWLITNYVRPAVDNLPVNVEYDGDYEVDVQPHETTILNFVRAHRHVGCGLDDTECHEQWYGDLMYYISRTLKGSFPKAFTRIDQMSPVAKNIFLSMIGCLVVEAVSDLPYIMAINSDKAALSIASLAHPTKAAKIKEWLTVISDRWARFVKDYKPNVAIHGNLDPDQAHPFNLQYLDDVDIMNELANVNLTFKTCVASVTLGRQLVGVGQSEIPGPQLYDYLVFYNISEEVDMSNDSITPGRLIHLSRQYFESIITRYQSYFGAFSKNRNYSTDELIPILDKWFQDFSFNTGLKGIVEKGVLRPMRRLWSYEDAGIVGHDWIWEATEGLDPANVLNDAENDIRRPSESLDYNQYGMNIALQVLPRIGNPLDSFLEPVDWSDEEEHFEHLLSIMYDFGTTQLDAWSFTNRYSVYYAEWIDIVNAFNRDEKMLLASESAAQIRWEHLYDVFDDTYLATVIKYMFLIEYDDKVPLAIQNTSARTTAWGLKGSYYPQIVKPNGFPEYCDKFSLVNKVTDLQKQDFPEAKDNKIPPPDEKIPDPKKEEEEDLGE